MTGTINYKASQTNDNATAGSIGEYISANLAAGSAATLAGTGVDKVVASIALTAGDWDVDGTIVFVSGAGSTGTSKTASISTTTSTPTISDTEAVANDLSSNANPCYVPTGTCRISTAGAQTMSLVANAFWSGAGGMTVYGFIQARRAR